MILSVALLSVLSACSTDGKGIILSGKVNNPVEGQYIVLEEMKERSFDPIDTLYLGANNTFSHEVNLEAAGFYRLNFYNTQVVNLILDKSNIEVNVDGNNKGGFYEIKGSVDMDHMETINTLMEGFQSKARSLNEQFMAANQEQDTATMLQLQATYASEQKALREEVKKQIRTMGTSLAVIQSINYLDTENEFPLIDSLATKLKAAHPKSKPVIAFASQIEQLRALAIGAQAPEITLPNPNGENMSLSNLKGKYVLVDFWAAWCKPCRMENPNVVRLYNQYQSKGFEVFSVSLDRKKEDWVKAIEIDGLVWPNHVSDLQYFNSAAAATYQVNAIPATFLLDKEGKIIGKNLRGEALERKLAELFD
ncbi:TlpA disulfide reductase family protein [Cytophagales bacterium LB-30]|uniref:TlpA disulfide reductase family protein n=1 Tax=Shiella aurantiaca TaxID=3058365 RepID=A0ABT8F2B5_9BACT|nr:TlpA disulfide reductase family protein [Shiella aurantiaca]MDN4164396.1 TlpA disulfide reductase family protein [Shiella aurantiaca]